MRSKKLILLLCILLTLVLAISVAAEEGTGSTFAKLWHPGSIFAIIGAIAIIGVMAKWFGEVGKQNVKWFVGVGVILVALGLWTTGIPKDLMGLSVAEEETFCGDGLCRIQLGENSQNCPIDCPSVQQPLAVAETPAASTPVASTPTAPAVCGNLRCEMGETKTACPTDCKESCGVEDVTLTLSDVDPYDTSVSPAGNHKIKKSVEASKYTSVANDGTVTVHPFSWVDLLLGDGNNSVETKHFVAQVPCSDPIEIGDLEDASGNKLGPAAGQVLRNTSTINIRLFNRKNQLISTADNVNATFDTNDDQTLTGDFYGTSNFGVMDEGDSEKGYGCISLEGNFSNTWELATTKVTVGGKSIPMGNPAYLTVSSVANTIKTFRVMDKVTSNTPASLSVFADVKTTANPSQADDLTLCLWRHVWAENTLTGKAQLFECGANQDGVKLSKASVGCYTIHVD